MDAKPAATCHDPNARLCETCEKGYEPCPVCRQRMPIDADHCNQCQSFHKGWRRYVWVSNTTLALITAALAVLAPAFNAAREFFNRHSSTTVTFLSATDRVLTISATNTGGTTSVLREYWLLFEGQPVKPMQLHLNATEDGAAVNAVPAGATVPVRLRRHRFEPTMSLNELNALLRSPGGPKITLLVKVQESRDADGWVERKDTLPSSHIANFIFQTNEPEAP